MYRAIITTAVIHYAPPYSACVLITADLSTHFSTAFPRLSWSYPQVFRRCGLCGAPQGGFQCPVCVQKLLFVRVSCLYGHSKPPSTACSVPLCSCQYGSLCEYCSLCRQANDRRGCREVHKCVFSRGFVDSMVVCFN